MKQLKKRTLALVLASVVTVVGAFASENYKNSILNLSFETTSNGINMNVETKYPYNGNVTPTKKDSTTYILMLPEINSSAKTPNLNTVSGNIKSVSVKTMTYTNNAKNEIQYNILLSLLASNPKIFQYSGNCYKDLMQFLKKNKIVVF